MSEVAVLVPVLRRPESVAPFLDSLASTVEARALFVCDPADHLEQAAVDAAGGSHLTVMGNYAKKINAAVRQTDEPLIFLAADDLRFRPGWFEAAKARLGPAEVVGVNDLIQRDREHTTHFLLTRRYALRPTIDGHPGPLCTRYAHNCVDDELIATARKRGVYAYAADAHVEHLHPDAGTAAPDPVYRKGRASLRHDRRIFDRRMARWM